MCVSVLFLTTVLSGGCGFIHIYIERELSVFVEYKHNDQTQKSPHQGIVYLALSL